MALSPFQSAFFPYQVSALRIRHVWGRSARENEAGGANVPFCRFDRLRGRGERRAVAALEPGAAGLSVTTGAARASGRAWIDHRYPPPHLRAPASPARGEGHT